MTLGFPEEVECALCGMTNTHDILVSTNTFGFPDLDTRPPEMERSTINTWIQSCSFCGYCFPDISIPTEGASEVVSSVAYKQQLNNPEFPKLANHFLCYSLIKEADSDYATAGWACIHAAWVCDDNGFSAGAKECRYKAVHLLQKAKETGHGFAEGESTEDTILVDLLRRSGQFELALDICNSALKKNPEKAISDILYLQKILIGNHDIACHTVDESVKSG
jgi:hypothetical protein